MASPVGRIERVAVSPKMIEAGVRAMEVWKDFPPGELVAAVYRAMAAVAPSQTKAADHVPPANFLEVLRLMQAGRRDV